MKKTKAILIGALACLCLTACNEKTASADEITSSAATVEEATEVTTVSELTEDVTSVSTEDTTAAETTETEATTPVKKISSSDFTLLDIDVSESEDDLADGWLTAAIGALNGNERYEYFKSYDPNAENDFKLADFENFCDENGVPEAQFIAAAVYDFNGDGRDEGFVLLETPYIYTEVPTSEGGNNFMVYVNEDGTAALACQGYEIDFGGILDYDGISHAYITMGDNNASIRNVIFSTAGGSVKEEFSHNWAIIIDDENDRIVKDSQTSQDVYDGVQWDCEKECYTDITVASDELF